MINAFMRPPHGWSSDHQGVSPALDIAAACRQAQIRPEITLPVAVMQAILTAEHIAKLDRQLGAPQAPACDATSNVSSSSHVSDLLFTQPAAVQQSVSHALPETSSVQPSRAARGRISPVVATGAGCRRAGRARQAKHPLEAPTAQGRLDALAACAAMLCDEADPPQPVQRVAPRPQDLTMQVCIPCYDALAITPAHTMKDYSMSRIGKCHEGGVAACEVLMKPCWHPVLARVFTTVAAPAETGRCYKHGRHPVWAARHAASAAAA